MNVGQILETHLGWASRSWASKVGEIVDSPWRDAKEKAKKVRVKELKEILDQRPTPRRSTPT